jgi:hypothetical protein
MVAGDWGVLAIRALWGSMPKSNCALWVMLCSKFYFKILLQMNFNNEEEFEGGSNDILADEYQAGVD